MPRKSAGRRQGNTDLRNNRRGNGFDSRGYGIRFYPRTEHTVAFEEYFERVGCDIGSLFDAVANNFKFSLTLASDDSCYFATLTDKDEDSSTHGCWLTLQAVDADRAIARVLWTLFELGDGSLANLDELAEDMADRWQ